MHLADAGEKPCLPWQISQWGDVVSLIVPRLGHGITGSVTLVVGKEATRLLISGPEAEYEFQLDMPAGPDRERILHPKTQLSLLQSEHNGRIHSCQMAVVQRDDRLAA